MEVYKTEEPKKMKKKKNPFYFSMIDWIREYNTIKTIQ